MNEPTDEPEQEQEHDEEPDAGDSPDPEETSPPAAAPPTTPAPPPRPRGRPPKPAGVGAAATPPPHPGNLPWKTPNNDAVQRMDEIFRRVAEYWPPGSIDNLALRIYLLAGGNMRLIDTISTAAITPTGSGTPGENLWNYVVDNYSMTSGGSATGEQKYKIEAVWRGSGRIFSTAMLLLPTPEQIRAIRRNRNNAPQGYGAPPSYEREVRHWQPTPPGYPYPYGPAPGYGAPPAAPQPQGPSPETQRLQWELERQRAELAHTQGMLQEALNAAREGRQPNLPPPVAAPMPPPAPGPAPGVEGTPPLGWRETIRAEVAQTVGSAMGDLANVLTQRLGLGSAAPGAPPTIADKFKSSTEKFVERALNQVGEKVLQTLDHNLAAGLGGIDQEQPPLEPEPAEPPHDPKDDLPFELSPTGVNWGDGRAVHYATNKETGELDLKGIGFGNPILIEKGMDVIKAIADAGKTFAERWAHPDKPHVVSSIPKNAQRADVPNGSESASGPWPRV